MHKRLIVALVAAVSVSACATGNGRPPVAIQETQEQVKLSSAQQWEVISRDISTQIVASLKARNLASAPLWVPVDQKSSTFNRVLASELRSALARKSATVSATPDAALVVEVSVDEVQHLSKCVYRPGTVSLLTAGVLAVRQIALGAVDPVAGPAVLGLTADGALSAHALTEKPTTEVVVTTSIKNAKHTEYVMHRTDIYYIDETEAGLYASSAPTREFKVVGDQR